MIIDGLVDEVSEGLQCVGDVIRLRVSRTDVHPNAGVSKKVQPNEIEVVLLDVQTWNDMEFSLSEIQMSTEAMIFHHLFTTMVGAHECNLCCFACLELVSFRI